MNDKETVATAIFAAMVASAQKDLAVIQLQNMTKNVSLDYPMLAKKSLDAAGEFIVVCNEERRNAPPGGWLRDRLEDEK